MAPGPEDEVTQAERRRILREGTTFHQHAQAFADEINQGRFAATGAPTVTGATAIPKYPAAGAHQADPVGTEPPLGFSVDDMPNPTGDASSGLSPPVATGPASDPAPLSDLADDEQRPDAGPPSSEQIND
jgi:hypothetical protein